MPEPVRSPQEIVDSAVLVVTPEDSRFPAPTMTGHAVITAPAVVGVDVELVGVQAQHGGVWGPAAPEDYWVQHQVWADGRVLVSVSAFAPLRYGLAYRARLGTATGPRVVKPYCVGD